MKVLSTVAMIDDLVQQIGGDYVDSLSLIRGQLDPHSYELVKGDEEKFGRADLIFYNGLGLEHGMTLRNLLEHNPKAHALGDAILAEEPASAITLDGRTDPHIWMDLSLWSRGIKAIVAELTLCDPAHGAEFLERGERLQSQLLETDAAIRTLMAQIPLERRYIVTSHDAFQYFTRRYLAAEEEREGGWNPRCAAPEGLSPDAQLSLKDIQDILSHIERYRISVIFPESNLSRDCLRKIEQAGREKGLHIEMSKEPLYGDAMGPEGYLQMMHHNAEVIVQALKGSL